MVFVCLSKQSAAALHTSHNVCSCRIGAAAAAVNQTVRVSTFKILQDFPFVKQHHHQLGPLLQHKKPSSGLSWVFTSSANSGLLCYYSLFANVSMLFIPFTHKHRRKSRLAGIQGKRLISNLFKSCLLLCIDS